jgi:hypothetical protein
VVGVGCLLLALGGCGALRRVQVFPVSIVNDTGPPVIVRDCSSFCSSSLLTFDLQPGASVVINRTTNMHKRFSVTTPTGAHIGCVDLYLPDRLTPALEPARTRPRGCARARPRRGAHVHEGKTASTRKRSRNVIRREEPWRRLLEAASLRLVRLARFLAWLRRVFAEPEPFRPAGRIHDRPFGWWAHEFLFGHYDTHHRDYDTGCSLEPTQHAAWPICGVVTWRADDLAASHDLPVRVVSDYHARCNPHSLRYSPSQGDADSQAA